MSWFTSNSLSYSSLIPLYIVSIAYPLPTTFHGLRFTGKQSSVKEVEYSRKKLKN